MADEKDNSVAVSAEQDQAVVDVGWDQEKENVTHSLVDGLNNEDIWVLIRRFNKQIFHLKEASYVPPGSLDLNVAEDEEFSPNKLRSQFERLYMGLIIGALTFVKHLARLRSWHEARRTALFCFTYFAAWAFDWLTSLLFVVLTAIMLSAKARNFLFPPAPLALIDYSTGGLAKPSAGVLGSIDSATGAPEAHKGEAVENEASNFVTGIAAIAMNVLVEKDPEGEPNPEDNINIAEPNTVATRVAVLKDKASAVSRPSQDKTKVPMQKLMWSKMRPMMHMLCIISDAWERGANLLKPTPPYHQNMYRTRLAVIIVPLLAASRFVTAYMLTKSITLIFGLVLFGDPLLTILNDYLNEKFPEWRNLMRLDCTIFKGVPTNAQLAIAILRTGESNKYPFPPPPIGHDSPSQEPVELSEDILRATGGDQPLNATDHEIHEAMSHNANMVSEAGGPDEELSKSTEHGTKGTKFLGVIRGAAKGAAKTAIGYNKVRAKFGSDIAKGRMGVVPRAADHPVTGPVRFAARYDGKMGYIYLVTEAMSPCITFVYSASKEYKGIEIPENSDLHWSVPITEIAELKKNPGYGFKSKLMMGWALDKEITDGVEIIDKHGTSRVLTAVPLRDGLFNRLCAIGGQKWEAW